jgi:hypothetical protein
MRLLEYSVSKILLLVSYCKFALTSDNILEMEDYTIDGADGTVIDSI